MQLDTNHDTNHDTNYDTQPRRVSMRSCRGAVIAAGIALMGTLMIPGTAAASSSPAPDELRPRLERACLRIPNIEARTNNVIARLQADATVRGSLAWLETQIDRATERGRDDLVEVLTNRLAVRQQTLTVLQLRLDGLPALEAFCTERGVAL